MDQASGAASSIFDFVHHGFDSMRTNLMAVVIAIIFAFFIMKSWGQLIMMTIGATLIHLLLLAFVAPLIDKQSLAMPPLMDVGYWVNAAYIAVFYLITLIVLFFLKKNVFKMGGKAAH